MKTIKLLFIALMVIIMYSCNNNPSCKVSENDTVFVSVDQMPIFPGGDLALLTFIAENVVYPENAKKDSIQGKVIIRFCVTTRGTVSAATILQGVNPELDAEALRVIKTLPEFTPGVENGKIVSTWYMIPITFVLK